MIRNFFYFFRYPVILFFINIFFERIGVYLIFPWMDIPLHFIGGFLIAHSFILIYIFLRGKKLIFVKNKFIFLFFILSIVSLIAILWEFWEYIVINFFNLDVLMTLEDTLFDLFMGLVGGIFSFFTFGKRLKTQQNL